MIFEKARTKNVFYLTDTLYLPLHLEAAAAEDTLIFYNILHNNIITIKLHNIILSNIYRTSIGPLLNIY